MTMSEIVSAISSRKAIVDEQICTCREITANGNVSYESLKPPYRVCTVLQWEAGERLYKALDIIDDKHSIPFSLKKAFNYLIKKKYSKNEIAIILKLIKSN